MTIQRTVWSPDTCDCQIIYEWDDSLPQDQREHISIDYFKNERGEEFFRKTCKFHLHHIDKDIHYYDILSENQSKNKAIGLLIKTIGKLDGGESEIKWSFNEDRSIVISHDSLTKEDKNILKSIDKSEISKKVSFE